jgi:hypothetical protein
MQQSRPKLYQQRRRAAPCLAVPAPAPIALSLPTLQGVPFSFSVRSKAEGLALFADRLAQAHVLRPEHWRGDISNACSLALQRFTELYHPKQLIPLSLSYTDHAFDLGEAGGYLWHNQLSERTGGGLKITHAHDTIGGFIIFMPTVMEGGPMCELIGPALLALENFQPRLGQTVLSALDRGLNASCRACTPRSGYGWAQSVYWHGESDESMALEEEFTAMLDNWDSMDKAEQAKTPKPTEEDVDIFRKRDYEKAIPDWAGTGTLRPIAGDRLNLKVIPVGFQPVVQATQKLLDWLNRRHDCRNDIGGFEHTQYECCPYLLRWDQNDPLVHIWDGMMNDFSNVGDINMDVNSVFAFHDDRTFKRALRRLRRFLEVLTLSENLIRALKPLKPGVRIPVRVRV